MAIYVTHILIVLTIQFALSYFELNDLHPYMLWICLAGYVVFLPLICELFSTISKKLMSIIKI